MGVPELPDPLVRTMPPPRHHASLTRPRAAGPRRAQAPAARQTGAVSYPGLRSLGTVMVAGVLLAGCGSDDPRPLAVDTTPSAAPAQRGPLGEDVMRAALLQPADLPGLAGRREFASADLTTQSTPQLSLCREPTEVAPHELASVIAKPAKAGQAQVFEIVSVFTDAAGAQAAYAAAVADTRACPAYEQAGTSFTLQDVRVSPAGTPPLLQYRLTTPDVVGGDVRSVGVRGRGLVVLTGYGKPPGTQSLLDFQAAVMAKALDRLPGG